MDRTPPHRASMLTTAVGNDRNACLPIVLLLTLVFCCPSRRDQALGQQPLEAVSPARADSAQTSVSPRMAASPLQQDASLYDVQFVGTRHGWAVGDRGSIWHTDDGGQSWALLPAPTQATLRAVCFLTNRIGWIVGGETTPYTRLGQGIVLFTENGGESWQIKAEGLLPRLRAVRFFGPDQGVVVGEATEACPTGIHVTEDGGESWQAVPGPRGAGWVAADFQHPEVGVVAGLRGHLNVVGGGRLMQPQFDQPDLRGFRAVTIDRDDRGWAVGDGALVLQTRNGGVTWQGPPQALPRELGEFADFRAVSSQGTHVWIAGTPGSVIWHSPDGGQTWNLRTTGQTVPINDLEFVSETEGWAVGTMGVVLHTTDGGRSWKSVRGGGRRAALLTLNTDIREVSCHLLTSQSAELGYRAVSILQNRQDLRPGWLPAATLPDQLHDAAVASGAAEGTVEWRFPIAIPGSERLVDDLVQDWNRRHEGRLQQVILSRLVAVLRTWRPSVIVMGTADANDAPARLLREALLEAVKRAADDTAFPEHFRMAGLPPWQVQRLFVSLKAGSRGQAEIDPADIQYRLGRPLHDAAAPAYARLRDDIPHGLEAFETLFDATQPENTSPTVSGLFAGLSLAPGSEARRLLKPVQEEQSAAQRKLAARQRNFRAYVRQQLDHDQAASQVLAQLRQVTAGMSDEQAALQLAELAQEYRRQSRWDLVEATFVELIGRYPDQPVSAAAMQWLFRLWTATEPAWQRVRTTRVGSGQIVVDPQAIERMIRSAQHVSQVPLRDQDHSELLTGPDPLSYKTRTGRLQAKGVDSSGLIQQTSTARTLEISEWRRGQVATWHTQAVRMASLIRQKHPRLYARPEMRLPLASLLRQRGSHRGADEQLRPLQLAAESHPWKTRAETELWLAQPLGASPGDVAVCKATGERPQLDGLLSDDCWQVASVLRLSDGTASGIREMDEALVMVAWDTEFLYLAGSVPKVSRFQDVRQQLAGRTYDADHSGHDRVSFYLDVDRDYSVWYTVTVDQRGWTSDRCWDDAGWNPRYWVAMNSDDGHWRFEMAIPFSELSPGGPAPDAPWAIGISRTAPGVGAQSWTRPVSDLATPATFGLLQFR